LSASCAGHKVADAGKLKTDLANAGNALAGIKFDLDEQTGMADVMAESVFADLENQQIQKTPDQKS